MKKLATEALLNSNYEKVPLKTCLKGRTLWCANQLIEIMPRDYEDIHIMVLKYATEVLIEEKSVALKLVAIKALIKYSRKLKNDVLQVMVGDKFETIID